jgi:hypothetical protein
MQTGQNAFSVNTNLEMSMETLTLVKLTASIIFLFIVWHIIAKLFNR